MSSGGRFPESSPLWSALRGDVATLEMTMALLHAVFGGFGLLIAVYFYLMVDSASAVPIIGFALWAITWFIASYLGMRRGWAVEVFAWVNPIVEILIPAYITVLLCRLESAEYAVGSWVPAQMFAIYIGASLLRLRPEIPIMMGIIAAFEYGLVYWFEIRPKLPANTPLLSREEIQFVRMFTLIAIGFAGTGTVMVFRQMLSRASHVMRSRDLFGKYQLGRMIASGGMGTVFEAVYCPEGGFQRPVAVKRIHPHLARNQQFVDRFRHEAELCARLAHPNIVAALDFGRVDDSYFFTMEYVDGVTLKEVMRHHRQADEPLDPSVACWMLRQVLEGLHYAHSGARDARGRVLHVVHRDLSPHNVLVDRSGQVKISDFGVARALGENHDHHTRNLAGKPAYMAPEQLRKSGIDERSDLFSLGVIAWEMLTNRRLFYRGNEAATMLAVLESAVPAPSRLRPELDRHWDSFCMQALARDPSDRYQTAQGMLAALHDIQVHEGPAGPDEVAALVRVAEVTEEVAQVMQ